MRRPRVRSLRTSAASPGEGRLSHLHPPTMRTGIKAVGMFEGPSQSYTSRTIPLLESSLRCYTEQTTQSLGGHLEIQPYSFKNLRKAVRQIVKTEGVSDYHEVAALLNKRDFRTRLGTEFSYGSAGDLVRKQIRSGRKNSEAKTDLTITATKNSDNGAIASLILESNLTKSQKLKALEAIL